MRFRVGLDEAKKASNPFGHLTLDQRRDLCMEVLHDVGARNIHERGHEIMHSCCLPYGNHPNGDRNPSASVNFEKMVAGCYVCGNGGWLWWVAAVKGLESSTHARSWVLDRVGAERVDDLQDLLAFLDSLVSPSPGIITPPPVYDPSVLTPWRLIHPYLTENRGVPWENIVRLQVGYGTLRVCTAPNTFVQSERIIIPHFFRDKLHGWQSRRLCDDGTPKYVSTPDMPKDSTLYNLEVGQDRLVVVESPMTVLRHSHHASMTGTFGASVTDKQMGVLTSARAKKIVLWFDNDTAGWLATEKVGAALMSHTMVWAVQSPFEGDPADLTDEQVERTLAECVVPFSLWQRPLVETLRQPGDDHDQEVRIRTTDQ
jgi:hypothetical protein